MNRGLIIATVVVAVFVAVAAGYAVIAHAQENGGVTTSTTTGTLSTSTVAPVPMAVPAPFKWHREAWRGGFRAPLAWCLEVSQEYNSTVVKVLESSSETKQLLSQGYSVAWIKPIVKAYISGSGEVTLKATQALVALTNGTAVYVYSVDLAGNAVTLVMYYQVPTCTPNRNCPCS